MSVVVVVVVEVMKPLYGTILLHAITCIERNASTPQSFPSPQTPTTPTTITTAHHVAEALSLALPPLYLKDNKRFPSNSSGSCHNSRDRGAAPYYHLLFIFLQSFIHSLIHPSLFAHPLT